MFLFSALSINQSHFKFLLYGGLKECIKTLQLMLDVATTMLGQKTSEEKSASSDTLKSLTQSHLLSLIICQIVFVCLFQKVWLKKKKKSFKLGIG